MYGAQELNGDAVSTLDEQLEQDGSAALRDMYLDRLQLARDEIDAALADRPADADVAVLRALRQAVRISEDALQEVWNSYHGMGARGVRLPTGR